jgi:hypothetical protein
MATTVSRLDSRQEIIHLEVVVELFVDAALEQL